MVGGVDSFGESFCKNCYRIETLENRNEVQERRIAELEKIFEQKYNEQQSQMNQMAERMEKFKTIEEAGITGTIEAKAWSEIVKTKVDEELKKVAQKVKVVEKQIEIRIEEDKMKERKKNNVIIHRMAESQMSEEKEKNTEDRKSVIQLINEVLEVPCEDKDIRRVFRLGKLTGGEKQRPILIEFRDGTMKNKVLENLSKLRNADEQLRQISVTHDMTESEREQCRELVKECKEKQKKEESGEWKYQVRGLPGDMRIVRLRKH